MSWFDSSGRYVSTVIVVLLFAFATRAGAAYWWNERHGESFPLGDSDSYWRLASQLADGQPYEYGSPDGKIFRAPGYPCLLAIWFRIAGRSKQAARYLGVIFGTVAVGCVMLLASTFGSRPGTLFAGVLAAVYPGAISTSVLLLSESPFVPWMLFHLFLWSKAHAAPVGWQQVSWGLLAGGAAAAAVLIRPSWLLFTPFALAFCALVPGRAQRWHDLQLTGIVLCGLCLGMIPWWVRNYQAVGRFVPTTLQVGASMYDAWNPRATGGSDMWFSADAYAVARKHQKAGQLPAGMPFEVYLDERLKRRAVQWLIGHPAQSARLAVKRPLIMWNPWPGHNVLSDGWARHGIALGFLVMIAAIGWGMARTCFWRSPYWLLWLPAAYYTLIHIVFVSSMRYRQPAILAALPLAAACWLSWKSRSVDPND
jgi:hypothetical protein